MLSCHSRHMRTHPRPLSWEKRGDMAVNRQSQVIPQEQRTVAKHCVRRIVAIPQTTNRLCLRSEYTVPGVLRQVLRLLGGDVVQCAPYDSALQPEP